MMTLTDLNTYLTKLMNFEKFDLTKIDPYMTNGLMVKGHDSISKIGFGVSASLALFEKAQKEKCDAIIVHHSFNLPASNRYDRIFQNRFSFLAKNEISLFGYHFLLDAHPTVGNNVSILNTVGAKAGKPFLHHGDPWGYSGSFTSPAALSEIKKKLNPFCSPQSVYYDFGPATIKRVVAISGKGAPVASVMTDLIEEKIDLYITGEVHEWNRELFREAGINFIAGGHYHTEMFGIKSLMERVKQDLPQISTVFLDHPNEV